MASHRRRSHPEAMARGRTPPAALSAASASCPASLQLRCSTTPSGAGPATSCGKRAPVRSSLPMPACRTSQRCSTCSRLKPHRLSPVRVRCLHRGTPLAHKICVQADLSACDCADTVLLGQDDSLSSTAQQPASSKREFDSWQPSRGAHSSASRSRPNTVTGAARPPRTAPGSLQARQALGPPKPKVASSSDACVAPPRAASPAQLQAASFARAAVTQRLQTAPPAHVYADTHSAAQRTGTAPPEMARSGTMARRKLRESRAIRDATISTSAWGADQSLPVQELFVWHMQVLTLALWPPDTLHPCTAALDSQAACTAKHMQCVQRLNGLPFHAQCICRTVA